MLNIVAIALTSLWVAANFYLWSMKQSPLLLFWESMGMASAAFPAFYWYVTRPDR